MTLTRAVCWLLPLSLVAASLWSANIALFNWWAAGGPPTPHPEQFTARGNFFGAICVVLLAAAVALSIWLRRRE